MPIVSDTFTAATGTCLENHTPDTGASWYILFQTSNVLTIQANELRGNAAGTTQGITYGVAPGPTVNDFDITFTMTNVDTGTASRRIGPHARMTTIANYYKLELFPTGSALDTQIYKKVAGVKTAVAGVDTGLVASDILVLRITDENKVVFKNGTCIISSNDNALTGLGTVGFSMGRVDANDTGNINTVWRIDNFRVDELNTIGPSPQLNVYRM